MLRHLVTLMLAQLRPTDLVVRYGGEEFLLVMEGVNLSVGLQVAERVRENVEFARVEVGALTLNYRISIGLSCSDTHGFDLKKLVDCADRALYRAKQSGRNRVCESLTSDESLL